MRLKMKLEYFKNCASNIYDESIFIIESIENIHPDYPPSDGGDAFMGECIETLTDLITKLKIIRAMN